MHGQFAMNIGATSILEQIYLDEDDSQDSHDDYDTSMDDVGLIKEEVRKDMRESNSPFCFWDYCVERRARINNLTAKDATWNHSPHNYNW